MTDRISSSFRSLRELGAKGLMPFVTGGYPNVDTTAAVIPALAQAGATAVEVGIPFSDPIADGPVIAGSMHKALGAGVDLAGVFAAVNRARAQTEIPIVAMVSSSIVTRVGADEFVARCAGAGFDGLIVPDIDLSDAPALAKVCESRGVALSLLVAPTTSDDRIREITVCCRGFIYLLARAGLTGESNDKPEVEGSVKRVRAATKLPIAAGFGISTAEHVAAVVAHADAAIVGSAIVRRMGGPDPVAAAAGLVRELAQGLPKPSALSTGASRQ